MVYLPTQTDAGTKAALNPLFRAISKQEHANPDPQLFIDYISAFNNIVPSKLITKLRTLGLNTSLCNWILDFLTSSDGEGRQQHIQHTATLTLNLGVHA